MADETRERWWVVRRDSIHPTHEIRSYEWEPIAPPKGWTMIGPAPDLLTAMQRNPEAFDYSEEWQIATREREQRKQAEAALATAREALGPIREQIMAGAYKGRNTYCVYLTEEQMDAVFAAMEESSSSRTGTQFPSTKPKEETPHCRKCGLRHWPDCIDSRRPEPKEGEDG